MNEVYRHFEHVLQLHDWANKHLISAESLVNQFVASDPYEFVTDLDPQTGQYVHKARLTNPIPIEISLHAFDLLNSLRACLDYGIYASSICLLGTADPKNTKFPFGNNLDDARNNGIFIGNPANNKRRDTDEAIIERMLSFEPYTGGDELLTGLNKLRNMKHHRHLATGVLSAPNISITDGRFIGDGGNAALEFGSRTWDPLKNELELFRTGNPEPGHNLKITVTVTLGQTPAFANARAIGVFSRMYNKVGDILAAIENEVFRIKKIPARTVRKVTTSENRPFFSTR